MSGMGYRSSRRMFFCAALLATLADSGAAQAQDVGSAVVGGLFQMFQGAVVASAWKKVDQPTINCLSTQYNINVSDMVAQGVYPNDGRVAPDIQACQNGAASTQQASLSTAQPTAPSPSNRDALVQSYGAKHADLILAGQIAKGMNGDEVMLAWGNPQSKTSAGLSRETWNYGSDTVSFTNGRVTDVGH